MHLARDCFRRQPTVRLDPARRFVGLVCSADVGALLRLGPEPLSLAFFAPSAGVWATGLGVTAAGGGEVTQAAVRWLEPPGAMPPGPFFGGWAFDEARAWPAFETERWLLPEVLAWWDGRQAWFAAFGDEGTSPSALRDRLAQVKEVEAATSAPTAVPRRAASHRTEFRALVDAAVQAIRAGEFTKVVVARSLEVRGDFNERALLKSLEARNQQSFTFLVRGNDGSTFIGASPELLCHVHEGIVSADALAGTAGLDEAEAALRSDKNLREHREVVEGMTASLTRFVAQLQYPEMPELKVLPHMVHLRTPIRGTLLSGVAHLDVARALSPTAAVCGAPRAAARQWLRVHEGFDRGWYAGAVGFTGPGGTLLSVPIRSALIRGDRASVFVGAGIVEGSTAEAEWRETEHKARTMLNAFGIDHA